MKKFLGEKCSRIFLELPVLLGFFFFGIFLKLELFTFIFMNEIKKLMQGCKRRSMKKRKVILLPDDERILKNMSS